MGISTFLVIFWLYLCLRQEKQSAAPSTGSNTIDGGNSAEKSEPAEISASTNQMRPCSPCSTSVQTPRPPPRRSLRGQQLHDSSR